MNSFDIQNKVEYTTLEGTPPVLRLYVSYYAKFSFWTCLKYLWYAIVKNDQRHQSVVLNLTHEQALSLNKSINEYMDKHCEFLILGQPDGYDYISSIEDQSGASFEGSLPKDAIDGVLNVTSSALVVKTPKKTSKTGKKPTKRKKTKRK